MTTNNPYAYLNLQYQAAQNDPENAAKFQQRIARQRIAELLIQRGLEPQQQGVQAGRFYVKPSWTSGLAQLASAGLGGYLSGKINSDAIDEARQQAESSRSGREKVAQALLPQQRDVPAVPGDPLMQGVQPGDGFTREELAAPSATHPTVGDALQDLAKKGKYDQGTPAKTETVPDSAQAQLERLQQVMLTLDPNTQKSVMPYLEAAQKRVEQEAAQAARTYSLSPGEQLFNNQNKVIASVAPNPQISNLAPGGTQLVNGVPAYTAPNPAVDEKPIAVGGNLVNPQGKVIYQGEKEQDPVTRSEVIMQGGKQMVVGVTQSGKTKVIGEAPPSSEKATNLSPAAQKELFESDDTIAASQNAASALKQALALNSQAFAGPLAKERAATLSAIPGAKSPAADATVSLDNLVTGQALEQLRATFGGMPTEGERKILLDIQGSVNLQPQQRQEIWERAIKLANRREEINRQKAEQLRGGTYMKPGGGTANVPAIDYGGGVAPFNDAEKEKRYQEFKAGHK